MSERIQPGSPNTPRPIDGPAKKPAQVAPGATKAVRMRPAFEALLQGLERSARELAEASEGVEAPADLADAVHRAGDSLQEALSIRDRILEAYRESLTRPAAPADAPPDESGGGGAR